MATAHAFTTMHAPVLHQPPFDPAAWLNALTSIGGGYALLADRRLCLLVDNCDATQLTRVMSHIVSQPDRRDAIRDLIEQRQNGEVQA